MLITTFVVIAAALGFAFYKLRDRKLRVELHSPSRPRVPPASGPTARPQQLDALDWESVPAAPSMGAIGTEDPASLPEAVGEASLRKTLRERYITARFPSLTSRTTDLANVAAVIKMARLYFEEEKPDLALELLDLANHGSPGVAALCLAQLEIAFLTHDADEYRERANEFRLAFPRTREWSEIARLGRAIVPDEPAFGPAQAPQTYEHYGPWPDTPNWIQASWDLTAEVLAADFHHAMKTDPAGSNEADTLKHAA